MFFFSRLTATPNAFQDATWEDAKLEPLVDYHFVFTLRLFLTHESSDIRTIAVHTLRHASLSDRILQLYTDLFIAELVVIRLYHETKTLCKTTPEDIQQLPVDEHPALCGIQERVSALKFIRHWFALTVSHKTIIPIPSCLFLGLVDVGNNQLSLPPDVGIITLKSKNVDPLRFFCLELLRDMALRLEFPLIRRFAAAGGITALVNAATDCVAFEVEPAFCCTLVVTISKLLGESGLKQPMCTVFCCYIVTAYLLFNVYVSLLLSFQMKRRLLLCLLHQSLIFFPSTLLCTPKDALPKTHGILGGFLKYPLYALRFFAYSPLPYPLCIS